MMTLSTVIDRSDLVRTIEDEEDVQVDDSSSEDEDVAQPKKNKAARQAKKHFEPEFSFVSSQKEYMHDTWNDIAKYCKKKARTNLDDKIAKIRKERKGDEAAPSDSGESSEEELSEDEMVEDRVKVKQGDLKRKMRKKATAAPDSGIDIQVNVPESEEEKEEEYFDSAPVYNQSDSFYTMNLSRPLLKAIEELKFVHPTPIQVFISICSHDTLTTDSHCSGRHHPCSSAWARYLWLCCYWDG